MDWQPLIDAARAARERAYAACSSLRVGAAVRMAGGLLHEGCNVENRTFGATICAERVAVTSAVAHGARQLEAVVVVTDTDPPAPPCGICREVLTEFGRPDLPILCLGSGDSRREHRLADLFPQPFDFSK